MSVLDRFPGPVATEERTRGERIAAEGNVNLHSASEGSLKGIVFDEEGRYETTLVWQPGSSWGYTCRCDTFRRGSTCAHVVATALAAERGGLLPAGQSSATRETRPRHRDRSSVWLSSTGQLRRLTDADE